VGRHEVADYAVEIVNDVVLRVDRGFTIHLGGGGALAARGSSSPPASEISCPTSPASGNDGAGTSSTTRAATAGWRATNPSACSAPTPARSSTPSSSANGPTTASTSLTPRSPSTPKPSPSPPETFRRPR
jgi:hypothetical protein